MKKNLVIKLGGILLESNTIMYNFFNFLRDYHESTGRNILVVHGGKFWVNRILNQINNLSKNSTFNKYQNNNLMFNDLKNGILSGLINKELIRYSIMNRINALGMCLTDGDTIVLKSGDIKDYYYDDINSLSLINYCFSNRIIPIVSPIGITKNNLLINIDSDVVVTLLAKALHADLIMLTDVSGVLDGRGNEIKILNKLYIDQLIKDGVITDGMITKVHESLNFAVYSNKQVNISSLGNISILKKIFYENNGGTAIIN